MRHWLFRIEGVIDTVGETEMEAEEVAWRQLGRFGEMFNISIKHEAKLEELLQAGQAFLVKRDIS